MTRIPRDNRTKFYYGVYYGMDFSSIVAFLEASKYFLIFLGSFLEGSVVMMGAGLLWHLGRVEFWPMYGALMLGDILSDMMWYFIGYFAARPFIMRWGHIFNLTPPVFAKVERRFHKYHTSILIISKLTMGFGLAVATLVTAGMLRISLVRYMTIQVVGGLVWVFCLVMIGYYFGNLLGDIPTEVQVGLGLAALVGAFFGLRALSAHLAKADW